MKNACNRFGFSVFNSASVSKQKPAGRPNDHSATEAIMRYFNNIITDIIDSSGLRLNRISKTSGISHTYLTKLIQGNINRPGKDKIASILLSLNYSITEINKILAAYDYRGLNRHDIPGILLNNRKRKIEGNTLPLYDNIHMRLLLSPMERLGGTKVLVKNAPSVLYMPISLYP